MAIVDSGKTVEVSVTYGLDDGAFEHIDTLQRSRNAKDLLSIRCPGVKNKARICGVASTSMRGIHNYGSKPRPDEVATFAAEYSVQLSSIVEEFGKGSRMMYRSPIMAAFYCASRVEDGWPGPRGHRHRDDVMYAVLRLAEQDWNGKRDPLKLLFNRILRAESATRAGTSLTPLEFYSLSVSACRASISGKEITSIVGTTVDWGDENDHGGTIVGRRKVRKRTKKVT